MTHKNSSEEHFLTMVYKVVTARAPVNIAVIKYWGKTNEELKIPSNDSLSGTLSIEELSATTSAAISEKFQEDKLWLNGVEQELSDTSPARRLLEEIRSLSYSQDLLSSHKVHIVSINNFPTAAGLASSAAGYACLAFVLGNLYGITDPAQLSILARKGSGSACRSIFGGFVQWHRGMDSDSSVAEQIVDELHWPQMRVVICVARDTKKDVSSSLGMSKSMATSTLLSHRSYKVVPERIEAIKQAIVARDFEQFAEITMQDSNQFHAICLDTWPPIFYLNSTSQAIINICHKLNEYHRRNVVAYTFDAGPNACIYLLEEYVDIFLSIIREFFPICNNTISRKLEVRGRAFQESDVKTVSQYLESVGVQSMTNSLKYIINTSIGRGPSLTDVHIDSGNLKPGKD